MGKRRAATADVAVNRNEAVAPATPARLSKRPRKVAARLPASNEPDGQVPVRRITRSSKGAAKLEYAEPEQVIKAVQLAQNVAARSVQAPAAGVAACVEQAVGGRVSSEKGTQGAMDLSGTKAGVQVTYGGHSAHDRQHSSSQLTCDAEEKVERDGAGGSFSVPNLATKQEATARRITVAHKLEPLQFQGGNAQDTSLDVKQEPREGTTALEAGKEGQPVRGGLVPAAHLPEPGLQSEAQATTQARVAGASIALEEEDDGFWAEVIAKEEARERAEEEKRKQAAAEADERKADKDERGQGATGGDENRYQIKVQPADLQRKVWVNRGPVLTLWAAIVAQQEGYTWQEAVTFGQAIAGNCAKMKGRRLGLVKENVADGWEMEACEEFEVFGTRVLGQRTKQGIRAFNNGRLVNPTKVEEYLHKAFSFNIEFCKAALQLLASKYSPADIGNVAFRLYEDFRPAIPEGVTGWGAKGVLDLSGICALAARLGT